jgi:hypothetical protein
MMSDIRLNKSLAERFRPFNSNLSVLTSVLRQSMSEMDSKHLRNVRNTAYTFRVKSFTNKIHISTELPGKPVTF